MVHFNFKAFLSTLLKRGGHFQGIPVLEYLNTAVPGLCCNKTKNDRYADGIPNQCYRKNNVLIISLLLIDVDERIPQWCSTTAWEDLTSCLISWLQACKTCSETFLKELLTHLEKKIVSVSGAFQCAMASFLLLSQE